MVTFLIIDLWLVAGSGAGDVNLNWDEIKQEEKRVPDHLARLDGGAQGSADDAADREDIGAELSGWSRSLASWVLTRRWSYARPRAATAIWCPPGNVRNFSSELRPPP